MASKVANRIFNTDTAIDPDVKKRLEEIQNLSGGIFDSRTEQEIIDIQNSANFEGQGYLSGKTPFARMWTAIRLTKKVDGEGTPIPIDEKFTKDKFNFSENTYDIQVEFEDNEPKGVVREIPLVKYPENGFKIYSLGMNPSTERNIYSPQSDDDELTSLGKEILPSQKNLYTDQSYQGEGRNLRPPAGITNITSTTQNSLGPVAGILTTTVNFIVYDFEEFDKIYSKYFLRPGAKIFLDFGWTDNSGFQLYDIEEALNDPLNFNSRIYGKEKRDKDGNVVKEAGQYQQSNYGMQFIQGQVTKFSSNLRPDDGAYECSITISSKNQQIFEVDLDEEIISNLKEGMLSNIEFRVIELAENALFPGNGNKFLKTENYTDDEVKEWNAIANIFAAELLSSDTNNVPTKLNTELGIFWKGTFVKDKSDEKKKIPQTGNDALYLSYGFIEDVLFNSELGKYTTADNQFQEDKFTADSPIEYDSSDGWTGYFKDLYDRQKFLKTNTKLPFLYPEEWDDSYNTRKNKTPSDFISTQDDKDKNRIPIREIFIKLSVVKKAIKQASTMTEVFNYLIKKMAESSGNAWDWGVNSGAPPYKTLSLIDKNYNAGKSIQNPNTPKLEPATDEDFFNDMFMFEPFSPNTIVKKMNLSLSPGDGSAISSKIALQGLGANGRNKFPANDIIDQTQTLALLEEMKEGEKEPLIFTEYFPNTENISDLEKIFATLEATIPELADPSYLDHQSVYEGDSTKFSTIPSSVESYINKTTEILQSKGEQGDLQPSGKPTEEYKTRKAILENNNFEFSDSIYEYYTKQHLTTYTPTRPTKLPIKLNLDLHGFTGFFPSDKFRVNQIPTRFKPFVYFQVMRISNSIQPGSFTTNLDCVMVVRDSVKASLPINTQKVHALAPFILKNSHKLVEIEAVLPFISYLQPNISLMDKNKSIEFAYTMTSLESGKTNLLKKQTTENAFVIKDENDEKESGVKEFEEKLNSIIGSEKNITIKPELKDEIKTFSLQYNFEKNKKYNCFIKGKNFLILEGEDSGKVKDFFDLVLTKFEAPKEEAKEE